MDHNGRSPFFIGDLHLFAKLFSVYQTTEGYSSTHFSLLVVCGFINAGNHYNNVNILPVLFMQMH